MKPLYKAIVVTLITTLITLATCLSGLAFLVAKEFAHSFIPDAYLDRMSDYYTSIWAQLNKDKTYDSNEIKIIDITDCDRDEIARLLDRVNTCNPDVVGMDIVFRVFEGDSADSSLVAAMNSCDNLVLPAGIAYDSGNNSRDNLYFGCFQGHLDGCQYGIATMYDRDDVRRYFIPSVSFIDTVSIPAFAYVVASERCDNILNTEDDERFLINYTTLNIHDSDAIPAKQILCSSKDELEYLKKEIEGRIVLIGAVQSTNDFHPTPMGYGVSGILINAHIINMLITGRTIKSFPSLLMYILCFMLSLFMMCFPFRGEGKCFSNRFIKVLIQLSVAFAASMVFVAIGTILFSKCSLYIDFAPLVVAYLITPVIQQINFDKIINRICTSKK